MAKSDLIVLNLQETGKISYKMNFISIFLCGEWPDDVHWTNEYVRIIKRMAGCVE